MNNAKNNKTMTVFVIGVVLLVVGVAVLLVVTRSNHQQQTLLPQSGSDSKDSQSETALPPHNESMVRITSSGFEPATIIVKKGDSLRFVNQDQKVHRIVSDPHPTHALLPGFDSIEPLEQAESYSFIFEKTGTFTYHDELNPLTLKGTVVVQ